MVKAGNKGSSINDVVWMGEVVNEAAKLCEHGNSSYSDAEIMVSNDIYLNLNEHNKALLSWNATRQCYHGNVINTNMEKWLQEQQRK